MNLYPGEHIDVGVSRLPSPASVPESAVSPRSSLRVGDDVTLAHIATVAVPPPRLDAEFFADPERVLSTVAHWTQDQLYTLANVLMAEGDRRGKAELLELLRWLCVAGGSEDPAPPGTKVEFVTQDFEGGVFWNDEEIFIHRPDGTVESYEWPEDADTDDEWSAKDERFRALLADYSRSDHPADGDHLVVDLTSGEFEHSGKWSLI